MTSSELAEFVGRVRRLFRGEIDEEIFALAKVRIGGLRLPVCLAALDDYALLYGGSRGKFIPAKFFEFYAKRTTTDENAPATKVEKAVSRHLADEVERERIAEDWDRLRSICQSLAHPRRSEIVNFLHARGWSRFPDRIEDWSQVRSSRSPISRPTGSSMGSGTRKQCEPMGRRIPGASGVASDRSG